MLTVINDLPDHVLGVRASGEVTNADYVDALVPAVEDKLSRFRKIRLLYVTGDGFEGFSPGAAWEDAKIGMHHATAFERVALVTDVGWLETAAKAFGFAFPGEVRVYGAGDVETAREWVCEPASEGKLEFEFVEAEKVLILRPRGELEAADFQRLSEAIDPVINAAGNLRGLMIESEHFPGWDDFAALSAHLRFVREHHASIDRVAIVTDDRVLSILPRLATTLLDAEIRHFASADRDAALVWLGNQ